MLKHLASQESVKAGHEVSDASSKGLMWFGIALVAGAIAMHLSLGVMFFALKRHEQKTHPDPVESSLLKMRTPPPAPRLESESRDRLAAYLAEENKLLSSYGWVDKEQRIARIPIQRAMEILAQAHPEVPKEGAHE